MIGYIYKIENKLNGHMYIGKTMRDVSDRWAQHCADAKISNYAISNAIKKYGKDAFEIAVITTGVANTKSELNFLLNALEIKHIHEYNTYDNENYNLTPGGDGLAKGGKLNLTESQRQNKRDRVSGKNNPCYGLCGELSPTYGRKHSPETIEKLKNKTRSKEHCQKIAESKKGKKLSEEHKLKIKEAMNKLPSQKGRKMSEEQKIKLSLSAKKAFENGRVNPFAGKKHSEETKMKMRNSKRRKAQEVSPLLFVNL